MGLKDERGEVTDEKILDSSFDMKTQSLLYLPPRLPDPNSPTFLPRAVGEISKILELTRGRAFLLFTSIKNMEEAFAAERDRSLLPVSCRASVPKTALLQAFKEDVHSVLFATASFWEGVDVQGEALSCVIIDRLPFSRPNEPILEARLEQIAASGGNPFWDYQVPFGHPPSETRAGTIDPDPAGPGASGHSGPRLLTSGYGKVFLASLPTCPIVQETSAVAAFFQTPG